MPPHRGITPVWAFIGHSYPLTRSLHPNHPERRFDGGADPHLSLFDQLQQRAPGRGRQCTALCLAAARRATGLRWSGGVALRPYALIAVSPGRLRRLGADRWDFRLANLLQILYGIAHYLRVEPASAS